jgi:hypothetical protein
MSGFTLIARSPKLFGQSWAIPEDGLIIGREAGFCDVCLPASATIVSRQHARVSLSVDGSRALIEDIGSKNGTWVLDHGRIAEEEPFSTETTAEFWLGNRDWMFEIFHR